MYRSFILLLLIVLPNTPSYSNSIDSIPIAEDGVINITQRNFQNQDVLLHGNWEFYWDTLINPGEFDKLSDKELLTYIRVPAAWSSKKAGSFPIKGQATYRLKIRTEELAGTYCIRLYDLFTASKVWFDGRVIYETGTTGENKKTSVPDFIYADVPIFLDKENTEHELVVHISNFHHRRSGIVKSVRFGPQERLVDQSRSWLILILLIVGIILFISINHLINYFLYKNEVTHLLFGLLCLVMILRNISTGQRILTYIFTDINWQLLFKLDNFSGFGTIPLFAIFLSVLYKNEFPKILLKIFVGIGLTITLFVFVTPQLVYGKFRMFFELYILVGGLFLTFYVLLRATIRKRKGALLTFIGFFILYATAINDVLISMGIASGSEVAPYGLLIYMLLQSFVLSRSSALAIKENKRLGKALKKEKLFLEDRVAERTKEIEQHTLEITQQQEVLKEQSIQNESLARINTVLNNDNKSDLKALSINLISEILDVLDAQVGVLYLVNDKADKPMLELTGSKNASKELLNAGSISPGEGLLGACYKDMQSKVFNNVSDSYVKLDSGLGKTLLKNLILIPLHTNKEALGVIEIASYNEFNSGQVALFEKIADSISSTIQFIKLNSKNVILLEEYQVKQSILDRNEEDMQQQTEELQTLREEVATLRKN